MITAGVIGWPISHSRSPIIHGYWLERYGIEGRYLKIPVEPRDLPGFIARMHPDEIAGINVTVPHKEAVFDLVSETEQMARRLRAVNTVFFRDGRLVGDNTDGYGFMASLRAAIAGWSAHLGPAVVLGAGGGARAIVAALDDAGVAEIRIVNRDRDRAARLAADLVPGARVLTWDEAPAALPGAALLVNTTSLGMVGMPPLDLALDALPDTAVVADIVYTPLRTGLLDRAVARGNPTVDGLGMLLHQARPGFRRWFGVEPEVTPELRALVINDIEARR
jgi:shikimate dehydrogenase